MDSIIIKIQAGLGNQLFQYALGRYLEIIQELPVTYDTSWFATQAKRQYELRHFQCRVTIADALDVRRMRKLQEKAGFQHFFHNTFVADAKRYVMEEDIRFNPKILKVKPPVYLDGFWQSERYFSQIASNLRHEITLKEPADRANAEMLNRIQVSQSIALHVRRGDYVTEKHTNAFHGTSSLDYYMAAVQRLRELEPNAHIFVFSDDAEWVKRNLQFTLPTHFVDINPPDQGYKDLALMAACKHHIIANSTFSWWGAWLGERPGQIAIAPKKWFNNNTMDSTDLVPTRWLRM